MVPFVGSIGLVAFAGAVGVGFAIAGAVSFVYYMIKVNKVAEIRTNYARYNFAESISNYGMAKDCVDQEARFKVYDQVYVSTIGINLIKTSIYLLAAKAKILTLFKGDISPSSALLPDFNLTSDAYDFAYSEQFSLLSEDQKLGLYNYYIDRYSYWSENYEQ